MNNKTTGKKIHVFIDAANIWNVQKAKGKLFDYRKLVIFLEKKYQTFQIKCFYYTAFPKNGTRNYSLDGKHKFYTFLKKQLGFVVRKKPLKQIKIITDEGIGYQEKGDMDVELTIDVLNHRDNFDLAIFFTGDSDYMALVKDLRKHDKKSYVYSSSNNISNELRTGADGYTDLLNIESDIWGNIIHHKKK